jgi:hypothetical protein
VEKYPAKHKNQGSSCHPFSTESSSVAITYEREKHNIRMMFFDFNNINGTDCRLPGPFSENGVLWYQILMGFTRMTKNRLVILVPLGT